MYNITIENGWIDYNDDKMLQDTGYLDDDYTNGTLTTLSNIRTKKELNKIINHVKQSAIGIHVFKLVPIPNSNPLQKKLNNNPWH